MADRVVQIELAKMGVELKRVIQTSVALFEEVQAQNPTTWYQLSEMMRTEAESSDLDERKQSLDVSWRSSLDALGINTNYSLNVSVDFTREWNGEEWRMVSTAELTLMWVDITTGQEVVATPRMQAIAEAQIVVLNRIFNFYSAIGFQPGLRYILPTLPSILLEAADLKTTDLNEAHALEELNFASTEQHQVKVTLDGILTILRAVFNELTEDQTQVIEEI